MRCDGVTHPPEPGPAEKRSPLNSRSKGSEVVIKEGLLVVKEGGTKARRSGRVR